MRLTADTNVLVRVATRDDPVQAQRAEVALAAAEIVAIPTAVFCEFVWVLAESYGSPRHRIAETIRAFLDSANVVADRVAIEAGLAVMDQGGDFADGVIALQGRWLGGDEFATFDRKAARLLKARGEAVLLL